MHHAELLWINIPPSYLSRATNQVLDMRPTLSFRLRQQLVIELLRSKRTEEALELATSELGPLAEEYPHLCAQLENVMALFVLDGAFSEDGDIPPALAALASVEHRQQTAGELNAAMLEAQGHNPRALLESIIRDFSLGEDLAALHADMPVLDTSASLLSAPCK